MSAVLSEIFLGNNMGKKDQNMTNPSRLKLVGIKSEKSSSYVLVYFGLLHQKGISWEKSIILYLGKGIGGHSTTT